MNALNFSIRFQLRLRAAIAHDVEMIADKDQRNLFQVRLRAAVAG